MRYLKPLIGLVATALCVAYLLWKLDLHTTYHVLRTVNLTPLLIAYAVLVLALLPLAWRWQRLLRARGIEEPYSRLINSYFVSYALGQILPTSLGGDATRIFQIGRNRPSERGVVAGSVVIERALGGFATLLLAAVGVVLAIGRYDVGAYLWLEAAIAIAAVGVGVLMFSRRARRMLRFTVPLARRLRLERPLRAAYEGVHSFREHPLLLLSMFALTVAVQAFRIVTIYLAGQAAHVHLGLVPYFVMGPLLFLVMLVPFTINGFAVRESFFVSFLTQLAVSPDRAFVTGFLYFLLSVALAIPGLVVLGLGSVRGVVRQPAQPRGRAE
ncbi:MAG TPA: lysylphosphatidylglycerol synthase transmembrane domain-containing protein [Gaiellaceae bacterium]|nr:lysylphosphatidylglycerol synthase transmembrane domain-containing protein [Gaiellaceae bacterium]